MGCRLVEDGLGWIGYSQGPVGQIVPVWGSDCGFCKEPLTGRNPEQDLPADGGGATKLQKQNQFGV